MGNIVVAGPSKAACISGGCGFSGTSKKYISGGWGWAWWMVTNVEKIDLSCLTLNPKCENVETSTGVPLYIDGIAQVRVMYDEKDNELLKRACQNFMGKSTQQMIDILTATLDGHLRGIVGQLTPQEVFQDRDKFNENVRAIATEDLALMGIQLMSFVVQKIEDKVQYFNSIGRAQTAVAKKDAKIGELEALRESDINEAECNTVRNEAKVVAETNITNFEKDYKVVKYQCKTQTDKANIKAKLAYDIQKYKELVEIREQEIKVDELKKHKQIEIAEIETRRKETELVATVKTPADFSVDKVLIEQTGHRDAKMLLAEAEAEKIVLLGKAKAAATLAIGSAESEAMKVKAEAMQKWGKAAIIQMVLESLPGFAAEVAAPLSKIEEIVILGGENKGSGDKMDPAEMMSIMQQVKKQNKL